jgi:hypothetical protein
MRSRFSRISVCCAFPTVGLMESRSAWKDLLPGLKKRGLRGVELVVSDDHAGLVAAIGEVVPEADWQRCYVHFLRNALDHLPLKHGDDCLPELGWLYDRRDWPRPRPTSRHGFANGRPPRAAAYRLGRGKRLPDDPARACGPFLRERSFDLANHTGCIVADLHVAMEFHGKQPFDQTRPEALAGQVSRRPDRLAPATSR